MKTPSKFSMIWLLSYISIASVSAAIITPALPNIEQTFALNAGMVEWIVSTFLIGYVIGQLIYGPLANCYGRIKALRWGLNINIVGVLICLLVPIYPHYGLLLTGRLISGLGSAAGLTCTFMLMNEWLPEAQRKTAMAYAILSFALGVGLAVLIGGVITQYSQWQGCFVFLLVQGLWMRVGLRVFDETLKTPKSFHIPTLLRDYAHALRSFKLLTFSGIWGACSAAAYCYSAAAPQIAHHYLHLSASEYGYWNTLSILGMLIGGLSGRILMHRLPVMRVIALGYLGFGLALVSLLAMLHVNPNATLWFFASACLLYCAGAYLFAGGTFIASNAIEDKASGASMMSFINMGVATLSVVVMGYLSADPFLSLLWMLGCVLLITLVLLLGFKIKTSRRETICEAC